MFIVLLYFLGCLHRYQFIGVGKPEDQHRTHRLLKVDSFCLRISYEQVTVYSGVYDATLEKIMSCSDIQEKECTK